MRLPEGIIGVVHLGALPGDPRYDGQGCASVLEAAARDAEALVEGGVSGVIVENFGSAPFSKGDLAQPTPPEQIAAVALAVSSARRLGVPVGVNVLRNDARAALGIAAVTGASFVRVNVHVGAYVTDQGLIEGRAFETLRARSALGAEVAIVADVRVKHAVPLAPLPLEREVDDVVRRGLADAVVVTGLGTGEPTSADDLARVASATSAPVWVGSGLTPERAALLAPHARGAIVGTWIKEGGDVRRAVDPERVTRLVRAWREARTAVDE